MNTTREIEYEGRINQFNPNFTFGAFVVGACNRTACDTARALATDPWCAYTPVYVHGAAGTGKTHLLHAIGLALLESKDVPNIVYTSSEGFMIDLPNSIRKHRMQQFDHRYRSADVLLIDDIQLLNTRSQVELFHMFNDLFERRKQIVLSGDSPPRDIPGLLEGLRLRLERGLIVEIKSPDVATKMAILEAKAAAEGITLTKDVCRWVAGKSGDVRALEAALLKLLAYSSLTGEPIDLEMTQRLIVWWPPRRPFRFL